MSASLRGRRAATQKIASTVVVSQLGDLRMAVKIAVAADTQALKDIRVAVASPRQHTQTMTGISATQPVRHIGAILTSMTVGAIGAATHQVGDKVKEGAG